jgi:hypothetical protein
MKISELIEELEVLKVEHGDLIVIAVDEEGKYEIGNTHVSDYEVYNGKGAYETQLAIRLCP